MHFDDLPLFAFSTRARRMPFRLWCRCSRRENADRDGNSRRRGMGRGRGRGCGRDRRRVTLFHNSSSSKRSRRRWPLRNCVVLLADELARLDGTPCPVKREDTLALGSARCGENVEQGRVRGFNVEQKMRRLCQIACDATAEELNKSGIQHFVRIALSDAEESAGGAYDEDRFEPFSLGARGVEPKCEALALGPCDRNGSHDHSRVLMSG